MSQVKKESQRAKVRTFSAPDRDNEMLKAVAQYHGTNKSAAVTGLIRKEFWRVYPNGTDSIIPDQRAKVNS